MRKVASVRQSQFVVGIEEVLGVSESDGLLVVGIDASSALV